MLATMHRSMSSTSMLILAIEETNPFAGPLPPSLPELSKYTPRKPGAPRRGTPARAGATTRVVNERERKRWDAARND